ncbi:MAG: hypothetical protein ACREBF_04610 [Candidatus Micrarchaeales archaeon]
MVWRNGPSANTLKQKAEAGALFAGAVLTAFLTIASTDGSSPAHDNLVNLFGFSAAALQFFEGLRLNHAVKSAKRDF